MLKLPIYLDNNATTPMDPAVLDAMMPYFLEQYGNASSRSHLFGLQAKEAVEQARVEVAALIGAPPEEILFTSGATESNNLALKGVYEAYAAKGNHIVTVATEHSSVLDACRHLEIQGAVVTYLPVDKQGRIRLAELEAALTPRTILIAVMYANNETGVLQPVQEIGAIAKKHDILFFSDATQAVGKVLVQVHADAVDLLSFSAHKLYGPKGIGALYVRRRNPRVRLTPLLDGGGQERSLRSGTLNVPGIVGFGKACELCAQKMDTEKSRLELLRDRLETALLQLGAVQVNGSRQHRLPQVANLLFEHLEGNALIAAVSRFVALSAGSACASASLEPSHVLKAMGLDTAAARSSLRFGLGRFTTEMEMEEVIRILREAVLELRATSPLWEQYQKSPASH